MALHITVFSWLWIFGLMFHHTLSKTCHSPLKVKIDQKALAKRPSDNVTLTCHISGVPYEEIIKYGWTTSDLIQIFKYNTTSHKVLPNEEYDRNVHETHNFSKGISTNLEIPVRFGDGIYYWCEVFTEQKLCRDSKRIDYEDPGVSPSRAAVQNCDDPLVSITLLKDVFVNLNHTKRLMEIRATCEVNAAVGKYNLNMHFVTQTRDGYSLRRVNQSSGYNSTIQDILMVEGPGILICQVLVEHCSPYNKTVHIDIDDTEMPEDARAACSRSEHKFVDIIGITIIVVLAMTILLIFFYNWKKNKDRVVIPGPEENELLNVDPIDNEQ